jgi:hypothetical protein
MLHVAHSGTLTVNSDGRSGSVEAEAKGGDGNATSPTGTIRITRNRQCRK